MVPCLVNWFNIILPILSLYYNPFVYYELWTLILLSTTKAFHNVGYGSKWNPFMHAGLFCLYRWLSLKVAFVYFLFSKMGLSCVSWTIACKHSKKLIWWHGYCTYTGRWLIFNNIILQWNEKTESQWWELIFSLSWVLSQNYRYLWN